MSIRDLAAADLAQFTAAGADLSEMASYSAEGAAAPFDLWGIPGNGAMLSPAGSPFGMADGTRSTFRVPATTVAAAIDTATGTSRLPGTGDTLTLRGATWGVVGMRLAAGGACLIEIEAKRTVGLGQAWRSP
jgi:hypothetical protein